MKMSCSSHSDEVFGFSCNATSCKVQRHRATCHNLTISLPLTSTDIRLHLPAPSLPIDLDLGTAYDAPVSLNEERSVLFLTLDPSQELDRAVQAGLKWNKMKLQLRFSFRMLYRL